MIEQEYKVIINYEQYQKFKNLLFFSEERIQKNYYYDTRDFYFSDRGFTIRIRHIEGKFPKMQIKQSLDSNVNGVKRNREYEKNITTIPNTISIDILEEMTGEKFDFSYNEVTNLGCLITTRLICNMKGCEIALDKNEYLNRVDYELEIEFNNDNKSALELLKFLELKVQDSTLGKNKRFILGLKEQG
ncbi:CYTH domain-containing protein [Streptococcus suis]|uniref:CYTH domain-containing protein n=1 Tax=Streptococcus suis TaxID=1307 RepID=UPI00192D427D|nr:CYTH domain-containing protein [Streptococcus suis]MBL6441050.1 CYTH domain-containing protein [Streptococcus suis]